MRLTRQSPAVAALNIGQSRLSRIVRAYIAATTYERDLVTWVVSYADPTGEEAVRAVMRERGR